MTTIANLKIKLYIHFGYQHLRQSGGLEKKNLEEKRPSWKCHDWDLLRVLSKFYTDKNYAICYITVLSVTVEVVRNFFTLNLKLIESDDKKI